MNSPMKGIDMNENPELRRAFDFNNATVDPLLKNKKSLRILPDHLKVSGDGVFYSVQGEGPSMGYPACFLRLHFCNLKCTWCDAWYTWNPNTNEFWTESKDWTADETKRQIEEKWECKNPHIQKRLVITGGEPLVQQDRIEHLIEQMHDWAIEIETNGTITPSRPLLERCQFNCSPKLKNSGNEGLIRIHGEVLQILNLVNTCFKFVVTSPEDLDEIERDFVHPFDLDVRKILVMPQGVTAEEVAHNARSMIEAVKQKGYRLLGRLHCDIWGAKRGV